MRLHGIGARWLLSSVAALAVGAAGCGDTPATAVSRDDVRQELEMLRHTRILFGHQSVGWNVIAGLKQLEVGNGQTFPIVDLAGGGRDRSAGLSHFMVGRNGDPRSKLLAFDRMLDSCDETFDLALLKFCYLDIDARTNVGPLFSAYRDTVA